MLQIIQILNCNTIHYLFFSFPPLNFPHR
jgi:hypothetical protein